MAIFDAKNESDARTIASLTEFKVGNFEGWGQDANLRRQMARALIFVANLSEIDTPEGCQQTFSSLWVHKTNAALKEDLTENNTFNNKILYNKKIVPLSDLEKKNHKNYLKTKLKNNFY